MKIVIGREIGSVSFQNCGDVCLQCLYRTVDTTQAFSQARQCGSNTVRLGIMKRNDAVVRICTDEVDDLNSTRCFKQKFVACFS